jgi:multicomponent Na+:H+ antiporter subunit B
MVIFYVLLLFMIIAAVIAIETKNLLSAIICIGAIGFGASLMFLFLRAPDIAITQIVVEVLGLIISGDKEFFGTVVSVVIIFVIFLAGIGIFETLPDFGNAIFAETPKAASRTYIKEGLESTGAANIVASVILDYRAYDTLGEATVLFTSIIGATVILRKKAKKLLEEPDL